MQINIVVQNQTDVDIGNAFCDVTGWTAASGLTKMQWVKRKIVEYLLYNARRGHIQTGTQAMRQAYVNSVIAARNAANSTFPDSTVT